MKPAHSIQDYLDVIRNGIPVRFDENQKAASRPKKVVIVGAGVAGLVAGYELKRQARIWTERQQSLSRGKAST